MVLFLLLVLVGGCWGCWGKLQIVGLGFGFYFIRSWELLVGLPGCVGRSSVRVLLGHFLGLRVYGL